MVASIHARLAERDWSGDQELAEDLLALLRGKDPAGRVVQVDLDAVADVLDADPSITLGSYLDLVTGETFPAEITDPAEVGEDAAVDVESDPDRWLWIEPEDSRDGWRDMVAFADHQRDAGLKERLYRAIEGIRVGHARAGGEPEAPAP